MAPTRESVHRDPEANAERDAERVLAARAVAFARLSRAMEHELRDRLNRTALQLEMLCDDLRVQDYSDTEKTAGGARSDFHALSAEIQAFLSRGRLPDDARAEFDVRAVLADVKAHTAPLAKQRRATVHFAVPETEVALDGRRARVELAVLHAAIECLDALTEGGALTLGARNDGGRVVVEVAPTSDHDARPAIVRADGVSTRLACALVEALGGTFTLDPARARGTALLLEFAAGGEKV